MKLWGIILTFLVGLAAGVCGMIFGPDLVGSVLPNAVGVKRIDIEGPVVTKQQEGDRLLLTIQTPQGAILATFKDRAAEMNLLVEKGDLLTLAVRKYEPFVLDPVIGRVRKQEDAASRPRGDGPSPSPSGQANSKEPASPRR
jgi:hypothetical protein